MSEPSISEAKPLPLHKRYKRQLIMGFVACVAIAGVLAAVFWPEAKMLMQEGGKLFDRLVTFIGSAGSGWFFAAYGMLPACGVPISLFNISAGLVFVPKLGIVWVSLLAALCLTGANALSYWLARFAMRPVIEKMIRRLGYSLPVIPADEHITACVFLRFVPGAPYCIQSYILGLAKVRFLPYMIVSFLGQYGWAFAMIYLGQEFDNFKNSGSFKGIFVAVVFVAILLLATRIVRRRVGKKVARQNEPAAAASQGGKHV